MEGSSKTSYVKVRADSGNVALLQLDRPSKRNALSQALIDDLILAIRSIEDDESLRAVVITGSPGGPFSGIIYLLGTRSKRLADHHQ